MASDVGANEGRFPLNAYSMVGASHLAAAIPKSAFVALVQHETEGTVDSALAYLKILLLYVRTLKHGVFRFANDFIPPSINFRFLLFSHSFVVFCI